MLILFCYSYREHHESETDTEEFEKVNRSVGLEDQLPASSLDSLATQEYMTAEFDMTEDTSATSTTTDELLQTTNKSICTSNIDDAARIEDMASTLRVDSEQCLPQVQHKLASVKVDLAALKDQVSGAAAKQVSEVSSAIQLITAVVEKMHKMESDEREKNEEISNEKLGDLEKQVELYQKNILELGLQLEHMQSDHVNDIHMRNIQQEETVRDLQNEHDEASTLIVNEWEEKIQILKENHEREIAKLCFEHESEGLKWEEEWKVKYSSESHNLAMQLALAKNQVLALTNELEENQRDKKVTLRVSEEQFDFRLAKSLDDQQLRLQESFEVKLSNLKKFCEDKHLLSLQNVKKANEVKRLSLEDTFTSKIDTISTSYRICVANHEKEISKLTESMQSSTSLAKLIEAEMECKFDELEKSTSEKIRIAKLELDAAKEDQKKLRFAMELKDTEWQANLAEQEAHSLLQIEEAVSNTVSDSIARL